MVAPGDASCATNTWTDLACAGEDRSNSGNGERDASGHLVADVRAQIGDPLLLELELEDLSSGRPVGIVLGGFIVELLEFFLGHIPMLGVRVRVVGAVMVLWHATIMPWLGGAIPAGVAHESAVPGTAPTTVGSR